MTSTYFNIFWGLYTPSCILCGVWVESELSEDSPKTKLRLFMAYSSANLENYEVLSVSLVFHMDSSGLHSTSFTAKSTHIIYNWSGVHVDFYHFKIPPAWSGLHWIPWDLSLIAYLIIIKKYQPWELNPKPHVSAKRAQYNHWAIHPLQFLIYYSIYVFPPTTYLLTNND